MIVEALTRIAFSDLEAQLRAAGFKHDTSQGAPKCRWLLDKIMVDVMPTEEIEKAPHDLKVYLAAKFAELLANPDFVQCLPGHLPSDEASQQRVPMLIDTMRALPLNGTGGSCILLTEGRGHPIDFPLGQTQS